MVETLVKNSYNLTNKEIKMTKDYLRGQGYVKAPKIENELGVGKDGLQQGGIPVEMTDPDKSQVVDVRGTKRMRPDKKPVKATWY